MALPIPYDRPLKQMRLPSFAAFPPAATAHPEQRCIDSSTGTEYYLYGGAWVPIGLPGAWQALTLLNGYTALAGVPASAFRKVMGGLNLQLVLNCKGTSNVVCGNLPVGFRPSAGTAGQSVICLTGGGGQGFLTMAASGDLTVLQTTGTTSTGVFYSGILPLA